MHSPNLHHCRSTAAVDAAEAAEAGGVLPGEDEDVAAERRLVQSGVLRYTMLLSCSCHISLQSVYCRHRFRHSASAIKRQPCCVPF